MAVHVPVDDHAGAQVDHGGQIQPVLICLQVRGVPALPCRAPRRRSPADRFRRACGSRYTRLRLWILLGGLLPRPGAYSAQALLTHNGTDRGLGNADPVLVEHPGQLVSAGGVVELTGRRLHQYMMPHGPRGRSPLPFPR